MRKDIQSEGQIEVWKPVKGFEGLIEVSNKGRVKRLSRKVNFQRLGDYIYKPNTKARYFQISFTINNIRHTHYVHRLVASTFLHNPLLKPEVNHIDLNPHNNAVENLEWCTKQENMNHSKKLGRFKVKRKKCSLTGKFIK